jgi:hypothetical protein
MTARSLLLALDKAIAQGRYINYFILEADETFAEELDATLRQASAMVRRRILAQDRQKARTWRMTIPDPFMIDRVTPGRLGRWRG